MVRRRLWKITHNGVDTHFIHFHLFGVQVVNRVGWDGAIKPPDPNELAFKDTVRMNPLEDVVVALRPLKQASLPWKLPNSVRPLDVTMPIGSSVANEFTNVDPTNQPAVVTNDLTNFGYEYIWHCHILGHEENDMMRPMSLVVTPEAPTGLTAKVTGSGANQAIALSWTSNSANQTHFSVIRGLASTGPWTRIDNVVTTAGPGSTITYTDKTKIKTKTTYYYYIVARNTVGYTKTYTAPAVGYPTVTATSPNSNTAQATTK